MVVVGAGTGGTMTGIARKVKERCPNCKVRLDTNLNTLCMIWKDCMDLQAHLGPNCLLMQSVSKYHLLAHIFF